MPEPMCSLDDCTKPLSARGWCLMHYTRWRRHGDPLVSKNDYGSMLGRVHAAAIAMTDECILITTQGDRRPVATINGRCMPAARAVWTIAHGDPDELFVLHTCHRGKEGCINIRHLYLGDHTQNMSDMLSAERQARGERSGNVKLTVDQVNEIRRRYRPGLGYALADEFGIARSHVTRIAVGESWAHAC